MVVGTFFSKSVYFRPGSAFFIDCCGLRESDKGQSRMLFSTESCIITLFGTYEAQESSLIGAPKQPCESKYSAPEAPPHRHGRWPHRHGRVVSSAAGLPVVCSKSPFFACSLADFGLLFLLLFIIPLNSMPHPQTLTQFLPLHS